MITKDEIAVRLGAVRDRIARAVRLAGRAATPVRLVLASKTQPPEAITAAYEAGAREFGENYVQEAVAKRAALATFDIVETLDSERLANALVRMRPSPPMPVLVEVNLGGETSKTGVAPERVEPLIEAVRARVEVLGLMTIPPPAANPAAMRPYFGRLRELRDRLTATTGLALSELSMGMTEDFEVAIEEGATIVRIGRAVFGERTQ